MGNTRVLITGGAGFIGSHLADELLYRGYLVRALDSLEPHVHGPDRRRPSYLAPDVELVAGDIRDPAAVRRALHKVDAVCHLAARVGVGPSLSEIADYNSVNSHGTAVLLEALIEQPVQRLIVASSMSVYGEGSYRDGREQSYEHVQRSAAQLARGEWEPRHADGSELAPAPTAETRTPAPISIYAQTKYNQERMCMLVGAAHRIPTVVLRLSNVYGPRQALSAARISALTIFAARCLMGKPPILFEDGRQRRDFVHVRDIATGCRLALESAAAAGEVLNLARGGSRSIGTIAGRIGAALGTAIQPQITGHYRIGDVRHSLADIRLAQRLLGYTPRIDLVTGLTELASWLTTQSTIDRIADIRAELARRGHAR